MGQARYDTNPREEITPIATFAGGCFWCLQPAFDAIEGVSKTVVGYLGGSTPNPTYEQVCTGQTGHYEGIEIHFDPAVVHYRDLLAVFWQQIDPTDGGGQFADRGSQYKPAIFYHDELQRWMAEKSVSDMAASGRYPAPILLEVLETSEFFAAEDNHQGYYRTCSLHYQQYKEGSGRAAYIRNMWGEG